MNKIKKRSALFILTMMFLFLLSSSNDSTLLKNTIQKTTDSKIDKYTQLVADKNAELHLEPLELTSYSEEVGAIVKKPIYKKFAANQTVTIEGIIKNDDELKGKYMWIKVHAKNAKRTGDVVEYYTKINNGTFKETIQLFNGKDEYIVTILVPSKEEKHYYYDIANFEVININPAKKREITYSPYAHDFNLVINEPHSGYVKRNRSFPLHGKVSNLKGKNELMIEVRKDDKESWQHIIPVRNGVFSYDVPLFYGKGIHTVNIYVPDLKQDDYYREGATLLVHNEAEETLEPIKYYKEYEERGITIEKPTFGGEQVDLTYYLKGKIDPNAPYANETTHLYITTKKGNDEALDVIPVKNFSFDGAFYLRFGPGTYEVTVSIPELNRSNVEYFRFFAIASFTVKNAASEDQRDLLPSRGIQSESPEIVALANELTKNLSNERKKAKAIYDYVTKNITYDVEKLKNQTYAWDDSALKTLNIKTGVCQDYAYLTIALLRASNIEARYVTGYAGERHAWVEAKVHGKWLIMDPTWGAGYIENDTFIPKYSDEYFDPDPATFAKTHIRTGVEY